MNRSVATVAIALSLASCAVSPDEIYAEAAMERVQGLQGIGAGDAAWGLSAANDNDTYVVPTVGMRWNLNPSAPVSPAPLQSQPQPKAKPLHPPTPGVGQRVWAMGLEENLMNLDKDITKKIARHEEELRDLENRIERCNQLVDRMRKRM